MRLPLAGEPSKPHQNNLSHMKLEYPDVKKAAAKLKFRTQAFIAGRFVSATSEKTFTAENPATGKPLAEIVACDVPDVARATAAARKAFDRGAKP